MDMPFLKRPRVGNSAPSGTLIRDYGSMDALLSTIMDLSEPFIASSIDLSLERLLDSTSCELEKDRAVDKICRFGCFLQESSTRSKRKNASFQNSISWPLPPDLTVKVFSALDTQSLCLASATCSMFNKCAMDPLCYANIDLTSLVPKVNNAIVSTMIQRAGKNLQSLKLGIWYVYTKSPSIPRSMAHSIDIPVITSDFSWNEKKSRQEESYVLTRSCLQCLSVDCGVAGSLLQRLHLYNIDRMDNAALCVAISSCPSLLDLEVVGLHVDLRQILEAVSANCHLMERLFFDSYKAGIVDNSLKLPTCFALVNGCPSLTSLALRRFVLQDHKIRVFLKGFRKLKYVDFSASYSITGTFLRNVGSDTNGIGQSLEVLILRDCVHLKEEEVEHFLSAVVDGDFKFLKYLDISNKDGLAAEGHWHQRHHTPSLPISRVLEERPEICLLAEFPPSFLGSGHATDSEIFSDGSLNLQLSSPSSDGSSFLITSESSYSNDEGSGNEMGHEINFALYEDSSDEVDFIVM